MACERLFWLTNTISPSWIIFPTQPWPLKCGEGVKNLYSVIKDSDAWIRFAFLTGVSKFSKVSLFSGLNNLIDITVDAKYGTICGYTEPEMITAFAEQLKGKPLE